MIKHRADSIKELNEKQAAEAKKDKTIAEQADTIELLKGCIMELADALLVNKADGDHDVGPRLDALAERREEVATPHVQHRALKGR